MAYFQNKEFKLTPRPIPQQPSYTPPTVPTPQPTESGSAPSFSPTFTGESSINIGITTSENININKDFSVVFSDVITIKEPTNLINPTIYINTSTSLADCNYMECFGRKYYILAKRFMYNNIWELQCKEDVLCTYKNSLLSHRAIVSRSSNIYNKYLQDKSFKTYAYKNTRTLKFPSGFNKTLQWVLVTLGGGN